MTKKKTSVKYEVIKGIANDETGERYQPGEIVSLEGWPGLNNWLKRGIIKVVKNGG